MPTLRSGVLILVLASFLGSFTAHAGCLRIFGNGGSKRGDSADLTSVLVSLSDGGYARIAMTQQSRAQKSKFILTPVDLNLLRKEYSNSTWQSTRRAVLQADPEALAAARNGKSLDMIAATSRRMFAAVFRNRNDDSAGKVTGYHFEFVAGGYADVSVSQRVDLSYVFAKNPDPRRLANEVVITDIAVDSQDQVYVLLDSGKVNKMNPGGLVDKPWSTYSTVIESGVRAMVSSFDVDGKTDLENPTNGQVFVLKDDGSLDVLVSTPDSIVPRQMRILGPGSVLSISSYCDPEWSQRLIITAQEPSKL